MEGTCPRAVDPAEEAAGRHQRTAVMAIYLIMGIVWIVLTHILKIAPWHTSAAAHGLSGTLGWIIFFIPLVVMGLAMISVFHTRGLCRVQNAVRGGNILYLGIIIAVPLFTLLDASYKGDRMQFALVILTSMMLAVLSQLDVWGTDLWTCVIQHMESALKTLSVGLLLFALALYVCRGKYLVSI